MGLTSLVCLRAAIPTFARIYRAAQQMPPMRDPARPSGRLQHPGERHSVDHLADQQRRVDSATDRFGGAPARMAHARDHAF
jgi:hypothetical protein